MVFETAGHTAKVAWRSIPLHFRVVGIVCALFAALAVLTAAGKDSTYSDPAVATRNAAVTMLRRAQELEAESPEAAAAYLDCSTMLSGEEDLSSAANTNVAWLRKRLWEKSGNSNA